MKKISVIIPTFNSQKFISSCIKSVLDQTYPIHEIIVVDDHSKDNTVAIISAYKKTNPLIKLYRFKTANISNSASRPRNFGVEMATGDYICFLDSDDYWNRNKVSEQIKNINKNILVSFTDCEYLEDKKITGEKKINNFFLKYALNNLPKSLLLYNPFRLSTVMIKKNLIKKFKFIDGLSYSGVEDLELWLRIFFKIKKKQFIYVKKKLCIIRKHKNNLTKNYFQGVIKNIYCISKFILDNNVIKNLKIFLSGIFFRAFLILWKRYGKSIIKKTRNLLILLFTIILLINNNYFINVIGNPLIKSNNNLNKINKENIFLISGHGFDRKEFLQYQISLEEFLKLNSKETKNIFILTNKEFISESFILKSLLIENKILEDKIKFAGEKQNSTFEDSIFIYDQIVKFKLKAITIITDPYYTNRLYRTIKRKYSDIDIFFYNETAFQDIRYISNYQKLKIILYEYISILYYSLKNFI